jgi:hypothetical protein
VDRVYREACLYAANIGRRLLYTFYSFASLELLCQVIVAAVSKRDSIGTSVGIIVDVFFSLISHFPTVAMLVGIFIVLVIDQRVSYSFMINLRSKALCGELTDTLYVETGKNFEERDKQSPMDFVLIAAGFDTLVCIVVISILGFNNAVPAQDVAYNVFYILVIFGNEVVIFLLLLLQILNVNEMVDVLLEQTTKQLLSSYASASQSLTSSSTLLHAESDMEALISPDERRIRRLELYLIMKEYRIGSRMLFYRPSKVQLMLQITSIAIGLATSILKVIVKSITG